MSLPPSFQNSLEYFEKCLEFFVEYEHLYNFPNTDILVKNILDQINVNGLEDIDITNDFDIKSNLNDYLDDFSTKLEKLRVDFSEFEEDDLQLAIDAPLSLKKKHEILYLSKEVVELCKEKECDTVVDIGCGLGYLGQQIFENSSLNVLGLECNDRHYVGAKKRQREYHASSLDRVKYIKHRVTIDSDMMIQRFLIDKFPSYQSFCIAGLHACADLTVDAMNLFLKMDRARALIIMPCCYHKLKHEQNRFENFPVSNILSSIYERYCGFKYLKVPFLRLATQPSNISNDNLEDLVFNLLARATLQVYAHKHNLTLKRNKRKAVRMKMIHNNFDSYIKDAIHGFSFMNNDKDEFEHANEESNIIHSLNTEELLSIWREHSQITFKKVAIFVLLQNAMQPVFENFLLYDRLLYLKENNGRKCEFKRIVDERVSPRCLALIVRK